MHDWHRLQPTRLAKVDTLWSALSDVDANPGTLQRRRCSRLNKPSIRTLTAQGTNRDGVARQVARWSGCVLALSCTSLRELMARTDGPDVIRLHRSTMIMHTKA